MAEPISEGQPQQQNPEKKDPRIARVIDKLTQDTRLLAGTNLLSMSPNIRNPDNPLVAIEYESTNGQSTVGLYRESFEEGRLSKLPKEITAHERFIPLFLIWEEDVNKTNVENLKNLNVWLTLDKDNPRIFKLVKKDGKPIYGHEEINGDEKVIEDPKLLPYILQAVSGNKEMHNKAYYDSGGMREH